MNVFVSLRKVILSEQNIYEICRYIRNGALFVYPTDTIYGLGCTASAIPTLKRIYKLKNRSESTPFSLLYPNRKLLEEHFRTLPDCLELFQAFLPNPLTLIVPAPGSFPYPHFISEDGFVGIRLIRYEPMDEILRRLPEPVVSTSVNPHGRASAQNTKEILEYFPDSIDLILEYDEAREQEPSTILKYVNNRLYIVREGIFPVKTIHSFFKSIDIVISDQPAGSDR